MKRTIPTLAASAAALALLAGCATADAAPNKAAPSSSTSAPAPTATPEPSSEDTPTPDAFVAPKPSDFTITIKVRSKDCFGSAGCIVEVRPDFAYDGPPLTTGYDITYQYKGDEDGPVIATATVDEDGTVTFDDESIDTPSKATKITAKVTAVEPSL